MVKSSSLLFYMLNLTFLIIYTYLLLLLYNKECLQKSSCKILLGASKSGGNEEKIKKLKMYESGELYVCINSPY